MRWAVLALAMCVCGRTFALDADLESLYGPADVAAVSGNGALTVGVNPFGRISLCRWPSPSYGDQISYTTVSRDQIDLGVAPDAGIMWGLRIGGGTEWLDGQPWESSTAYPGPTSTIVVTHSRKTGSSLSVTQETFVVPGQDLLVMRIEVSGLDARPTLYWYANFTPCTRLIPEWPLADWALDSLNDFAVFADTKNGLIYHFRPNGLGQAQWEQANRFVSHGAGMAEWSSFGEGTYIAYSTQQRISALQCGTEGTPDSAYTQASRGELKGRSSACGPCNSTIALEPSEQHGVYVATVFVGFGKDAKTASDLATRYLGQTYPLLRNEVSSYWKKRIAKANLPADPALADLCKRCMTTIAVCADAATGAIVRSPVTQPPLSLDWPRLGVWTVEALRAAGLADQAQRQLDFHLSTQRKVESPGRPEGSFPAACYANGVEGVPHAAMETLAAAWTVWSAWSQGADMPPEAGVAFWKARWPQIQKAMEFLATWTDERSGWPFYAFDPARMRDAETAQQLVLTFLALDKGITMAQALDITAPPLWNERRTELDALVKLNCFDDKGVLKPDVPDAFLLAGVLGPDDPRWKPVVGKRLADMDGMDVDEAAKSLLGAAWLWRERPALLETLRPTAQALAERVKGQGTASIDVDAVAAARLYLVLMLVFGSPT